MRLPLSLLCLASVALPASAMGQTRDADQDAEIQRLRQTVEQLTARIQALEGGQAASTAPAAPVGVAVAPGAVSAPAGGAASPAARPGWRPG